LQFNPPNVTIREGGSINFIFQSVAHNVIFDDVPGAPIDIEDAPSSVTRNVEFPTAGTFPYHCDIHPTMTGTVTVAELEN
jgi:plastocyanin